MRGIALTVVGIHVLTGAGMAQQVSTPPAFDVASIKPNNGPPFQDASWGYPPGRFLVRNMGMRWTIAMVYGEADGFPLDRVLGGPSWLDTDRYDVEGKVGDPNASETVIRAMARSLLEQRLALNTHVERRELPIYNLVNNGAARPGGQLRASTGDDCVESAQTESKALPACGIALPKPSGSGTTFSAYHVTMDEITDLLQPFVDRPLVNRTNRDGRFSFTLTVRRADLGDSESALMSQALQDQLGLRLAGARGPVDVLVIDSVERPTPN